MSDLDDLTMFKTPMSWPAWPYLPIKTKSHRRRADGWPELGFLYDTGDETPKPVIYKTNMFGLASLPGRSIDEKLESVETEEYSSLEAIADDWIVD